MNAGGGNAGAETNYRWAWRLLDGLAASGVKRAVVSPGSRSTPLALAALRHPGIAVHVAVDERSAAFFALGLAKAEGIPAALVATSGSAVANWLPAVVEADMARVPMILLSADRPPELHDCGANQTMDQVGLFGSHVRAFHHLPPAQEDAAWLAPLAARCVAASLGPLPGPVHVNVPLREPLVPAAAERPAAVPAPHWLDAVPRADDAALAVLERILAAGPGAIVCGPEDLGAGARAAAAELAQRLRVPLFADILSSLRCGAAGAEVLAHPDQVARSAPPPAWLLRLGGTPVSRAVNGWLERAAGRPQIVAANHPRVADPAGVATHIVRADVTDLCRRLAAPAAPAAWLDGFVALDAAAGAVAEAACDEAPFEGALLRALLRQLPARTPVFLGNSLSVRAADWFVGRTPQLLRLFGNRGVSGIDGNLSTACGIAAACGRALAVVGDLAFLHDLNALALARDCRLAVLLLDNGGGGIFDHLALADLPEFEQAWLTPQSLDPAHAAAAFGLSYQRAAGVRDAVANVLAALESPAASIVHVSIDRHLSLARIRAFHSACNQGA